MGAYLGAWVNAQGKASQAASQRGPADVASFEAAIAKPLKISNVFISWKQPVPAAALQQEAAKGTISMLDWHCGDADTAVAAGSDDGLIKAAADALRSVGHPIFLRWYWEMAFQTDPQTAVCRGTGPATEQAAAYVAAWKHIWTVFQQEGATNVAFVWCPGGNGITTKAVPYYPGDQYVDWIAVDEYALNPATTSTFAQIMKPFYDRWSAEGKPLMVAETGALAGTQTAFLQGAASALQSQFPDLKALLYFDGSGPRGNWSLDPNGLTEFKSLASSSFFSPTAP